MGVCESCVLLEGAESCVDEQAEIKQVLEGWKWKWLGEEPDTLPSYRCRTMGWYNASDPDVKQMASDTDIWALATYRDIRTVMAKCLVEPEFVLQRDDVCTLLWTHLEHN